MFFFAFQFTFFSSLNFCFCNVFRSFYFRSLSFSIPGVPHADVHSVHTEDSDRSVNNQLLLLLLSILYFLPFSDSVCQKSEELEQKIKDFFKCLLLFQIEIFCSLAKSTGGFVRSFVVVFRLPFDFLPFFFIFIVYSITFTKKLQK